MRTSAAMDMGIGWGRFHGLWRRRRPAGRRRAGQAPPLNGYASGARIVVMMLSALSLAALSVLAFGCTKGGTAPGGAAAGGGKMIVFVTVLPEAYLTERIAGEHARVEVLVGPGQDPHTFEPAPKQMALLSGAKLYFTIGMPFEESLCRKLASGGGAAGPRIVDVRKGIQLLAAPEEEHESERQAGHDAAVHPHTANETDPHVWMSPRLAATMVRTMCEALSQADPAHKADFQRNLAALQADLETLGQRIARALAPVKGRTFFVYHPAFGYFAAEYGLRQEAIETGGKAPDLKHIRELIDRAKADGVKVIFVQPQFSARTAETIASQIGGTVVAIDPEARDYLANLQHVAEEIEKSLKAEGTKGATSKAAKGPTGGP
jgi:zinc transport system substrate-binding protein